ncbi:carboxyl transferase domain protein [Mycobacterium xenopi 4042]|uniref:Carboxyl transferase domain protein n=1 Tax=Mycobacterium xenopi 4042 TaxID=1299334 RepID=X7YLD2_MYCXE|nr:carboxyl transferase domain protein [Mycobacterium xenopi 4042]
MTSVTDHHAEPAAEHTVDIHTTAGKLAELRKRLEETLHPVGVEAVDKVHAKGKLTARERIYALLDEGSFVELDALARHRSSNFGLDAKRPLGDGVVTGYGTIDGRDVCIFSQDATVFGGSLGEVYGEKIVKVQNLAIKTGRPLIGINDGAGARIQEGVVSLGLYSRIFYNNIMASGAIPQISLIMGAPPGARVLSCPDRFRGDGRPDQPDVHHRPGRDQDGHRRGRHDGGARRRPHPHGQVRHLALCRLR